MAVYFYIIKMSVVARIRQRGYAILRTYVECQMETSNKIRYRGTYLLKIRFAEVINAERAAPGVAAAAFWSRRTLFYDNFIALFIAYIIYWNKIYSR